MQKNFTIRPGFAEIAFDGIVVDFHNLYGIEGVSMDAGGASVSIVFRKDDRWANDGPGQLTLTCTGNVLVSFDNLARLPPRLFEASVEIAYFDAGMGWDALLDEAIAQRQGFDGIQLLLDEFNLRVRCDVARFATL